MHDGDHALVTTLLDVIATNIDLLEKARPELEFGKIDFVISGGENISSIEVEDTLYKHPDITAAAVVAKPDDKWGETPCAFVEVRAGAEITQDDVIEHCREHLARFKCPKHVVFTDLPKTSTGKIQKFKLRDQAIDA